MRDLATTTLGATFSTHGANCRGIFTANAIGVAYESWTRWRRRIRERDCKYRFYPGSGPLSGGSLHPAVCHYDHDRLVYMVTAGLKA